MESLTVTKNYLLIVLTSMLFATTIVADDATIAYEKQQLNDLYSQRAALQEKRSELTNSFQSLTAEIDKANQKSLNNDPKVIEAMSELTAAQIDHKSNPSSLTSAKLDHAEFKLMLVKRKHKSSNPHRNEHAKLKQELQSNIDNLSQLTAKISTQEKLITKLNVQQAKENEQLQQNRKLSNLAKENNTPPPTIDIKPKKVESIKSPVAIKNQLNQTKNSIAIDTSPPSQPTEIPIVITFTDATLVLSPDAVKKHHKVLQSLTKRDFKKQKRKVATFTTNNSAEKYKLSLKTKGIGQYSGRLILGVGQHSIRIDEKSWKIEIPKDQNSRGYLFWFNALNQNITLMPLEMIK